MLSAIGVLLLSVVPGALSVGAVRSGHLQAQPGKSKTAQAAIVNAKNPPPATYEDDEIRLQLPAGWMIATKEHPAVAPSLGPEHYITGNGRLLLMKNGYTLSLAYNTGHTSGIVGGRFVEILAIPWLDSDQAWTCSLSLVQSPEPANRALMFVNLSFHTGDEAVREKCDIHKDLGYWTKHGTEKEFIGEQRWLAGYFTTADGGWFFQSDGAACGEKAYALTTSAETPEELPPVSDPVLQKMITEAIDIVGSVSYKRCPPAMIR
jgi:hypothetical protein